MGKYQVDMILVDVEKIVLREKRKAIRDKSPFHAKALAYFDKLNADERYWR